MLQRKGGVTLDQIMKATRWQKHTVRGFISILGSKGGMKVRRTRRESDGAGVYEAKGINLGVSEAAGPKGLGGFFRLAERRPS